ncbi:hypothetical protein Trydic_g4813 [Trypoxylus dichotomus]
MTSEWSLSEDETLSDHKFIRFDINNGNNTEQRQTVKRGFCAKKADWEMFGNAFSTATAGLIEEIDNSTRTREIETIAKRINNAVITACEQSMHGRERSGSVDSVIGTPEEVCLKRVRVLTNAILELVPVKSETLKVEDRKRLRDMVCEINQLFGEQNGILREVRSAAEKRATAEPTPAPANPRQTYADRLKRSSVTVAVQPSEKQTSEYTKKQLAEKVDVVANKIGVRGVKKGRDGAVFVECSSKKDAEKLRISVAEKMQDAKVREIKKNNPVVCVYGLDEGLTADKVAECIRQQNEIIESVYENGEKVKEDFKVFRFYATPRDGKRTVKN